MSLLERHVHLSFAYCHVFFLILCSLFQNESRNITSLRDRQFHRHKLVDEQFFLHSQYSAPRVSGLKRLHGQ
jgi:hypothetical protein